MNKNLIDDQVKCLLLCNYQNLNSFTCDNMCKSNTDLKQTKAEIESEDKEYVGEGCSGSGKEICYKLCRLHSHESIEKCLCACCNCKF